jgi:hypothetical protein
LGVNTLAHERKYLGENGPSLCLESCDFDHKCAPSSVQDLVFRFIHRLYQAVDDDPLKYMNATFKHEELLPATQNPAINNALLIFPNDRKSPLILS